MLESRLDKHTTLHAITYGQGKRQVKTTYTIDDRHPIQQQELTHKVNAIRAHNA